MTSNASTILLSFEQLPEPEKKEVAYEILRRTTTYDFPSLSDELLIENAENIFLELEKKEDVNGSSSTR